VLNLKLKILLECAYTMLERVAGGEDPALQHQPMKWNLLMQPNQKKKKREKKKLTHLRSHQRAGIITWTNIFNNRRQHPKSVLFFQEEQQPASQKIHSLTVADSFISSRICFQNSLQFSPFHRICCELWVFWKCAREILKPKFFLPFFSRL
jgi:hypothetical protein